MNSHQRRVRRRMAEQVGQFVLPDDKRRELAELGRTTVWLTRRKRIDFRLRW